MRDNKGPDTPLHVKREASRLEGSAGELISNSGSPLTLSHRQEAFRSQIEEVFCSRVGKLHKSLNKGTPFATKLYHINQ